MVYAQYLSKEFSFDNSNKHNGIRLGVSIQNKDSIIALNKHQTISGVFVSGNIVLSENERSFVRITIEDEYKNEYLVYEAYPLISDNECSFSKVGLETIYLNNIQVNQLKIETLNASVLLDSIYYIHEVSPTMKQKAEYNRVTQCEYIANKINHKLSKTNKTWTAGVTDIALMTYEDRKALFGGRVPMLYGFDYYKRGIFVIPEYENKRQMPNEQDNRYRSSYVSEWDWRNRHGKNWMTPIRNQGSCGSCWAFATIGTFEPYINLYYNRLINYDLSEQEVLSCSGAGTCASGSISSAFNYVRTNGAIPEDCFAYTATQVPCNNQCGTPNDRIYFEQYSTPSVNEASIKEALFKSPISFGNRPWFHFLVLAGYKQIQSGDNYFTSGNALDTITIDPEDPLVGETAWLLKNSWGTGWGDNGYGYVAMFLSDAYGIYKISGNVTSSIWADSDIVCEDADNDGYYFWGLGSKPDHCPICCPDTPDGDDSNPLLAEMDTYGNFAPYTFPYDTTTISSNSTWNTDTTHCGNIVVTNNATLTISAQLTMNPAAKIIVQNGGTLIVDGGSIVNATVDVQNSAKFQLLNNGTLYLKQLGNLKVQLGAEAEMEYGRILLQ